MMKLCIIMLVRWFNLGKCLYLLNWVVFILNFCKILNVFFFYNEEKYFFKICGILFVFLCIVFSILLCCLCGNMKYKSWCEKLIWLECK